MYIFSWFCVPCSFAHSKHSSPYLLNVLGLNCLKSHFWMILLAGQLHTRKEGSVRETIVTKYSLGKGIFQLVSYHRLWWNSWGRNKKKHKEKNPHLFSLPKWLFKEKRLAPYSCWQQGSGERLRNKRITDKFTGQRKAFSLPTAKRHSTRVDIQEDPRSNSLLFELSSDPPSSSLPPLGEMILPPQSTVSHSGLSRQHRKSWGNKSL